ncbi:MAG: hypothetical protein ACYDDA_14875 [Acidiferrobacteraceae bacterium]
MINLQGFCLITDVFCTENKRYLQSPFTVGAFTYASNGHIAVRVPYQDEYPVVTTSRIPENFSGAPVDLRPFPEDFPDLHDEYPCPPCQGSGKIPACETCRGDGTIECGECGHERDCPDCDGRRNKDGICERCHGTGRNERLLIVQVGSARVNASYLRMIRVLPGVRIDARSASDGSTPLAFVFEGGEGRLMPMRALSADVDLTLFEDCVEDVQGVPKRVVAEVLTSSTGIIAEIDGSW